MVRDGWWSLSDVHFARSVVYGAITYRVSFYNLWFHMILFSFLYFAYTNNNSRQSTYFGRRQFEKVAKLAKFRSSWQPRFTRRARRGVPAHLSLSLQIIFHYRRRRGGLCRRRRGLIQRKATTELQLSALNTIWSVAGRRRRFQLTTSAVQCERLAERRLASMTLWSPRHFSSNEVDNIKTSLNNVFAQISTILYCIFLSIAAILYMSEILQISTRYLLNW